MKKPLTAAAILLALALCLTAAFAAGGSAADPLISLSYLQEVFSPQATARAEEKLALARYEFAQPPLLTDAEIEEILGKLDDLTRWAEEIKAYAQDAALNHGKQWHGFKVVEGRSVRKYSNEDAVIEAANAAGYHDIFRKSLLPITEMEKLMGKQGFAEILGGLIVKPAGKPTLVPASDKRPAITNAKIDFNEIQED